ncbi:MAG: AAA family ATPase [Desulfobacteraceae bacterium]|nr:MAG: AAA family ATPase [Desulfobacteraceae bacterium]
MYLEHYRLKLKPFQITADPKFLWLGGKHREALALLRNGLMAKRGFVRLSGEVGTGKTVLIKRLISEMDFDIALVTLTSPGLNSKNFYNLLSDGFKIKHPFDRRDDFIPHLRELLNQGHNGRQQVLIIDEAQRLNHDLIKEVRWLSNIALQGRKLIDIFFVGQPELNDLLSRPENRDLAQRITIRHQIEPLEEIEIAAYIEHRLATAGCDLEIFTPAAIFVIYELTGGVPRLINRVCDRALLTGEARGLEKIDENVIREGAAELDLPIKTRRLKDDPPAKDRVAGSSGMQSSGWDFPPQAISGQNPAPAPQYRPRWKWLYAVPILLLVAYLSYHFNYLGAEQGPRSDRVSGYLSTDPSAGLSTEVMPFRPAKENRSPSLLKEKVLITFDLNSNALDRKSFGLLDSIASQMVKHPEQTVIIRGYTDSSGPIDLNVRISRLRAEAVKSYLIGKGAESEKIEVIAMGPENPIASNDTAESRRQNRRVEIEFPQN